LAGTKAMEVTSHAMPSEPDAHNLRAVPAQRSSSYRCRFVPQHPTNNRAAVASCAYPAAMHTQGMHEDFEASCRLDSATQGQCTI
jgi:hypothetical protein